MSFYGLEIAKSALSLSQKGMNLAGQNIANAATEGYTRQRLNIVSIEPVSLSGRYLALSVGAVGGGATATSVDQIRSAYIDSALRKEYSSQGQWDTRATEMKYLESLFDETSTSLLSKSFTNFFDSLQELTEDTVSKEIRTNVQQDALTLTQTLNSYYSQLSDLQSQMNESIKTTVDRINEISKSIADYNKSIYTYEMTGENANDLRDKRNLLLDELSKLVDTQYSEDSDGKLSVSVAGNTIVNHGNYTELTAVADQTGVVSGTTGFYRVCIEDADGNLTNVAYTDGSLAGYKQLRDGNTADDMGIPYLMDKLNTLARGLAQQFNAVNKAGYTMPHDAEASVQNINFFKVPLDGDGDEDYSLITAGNLTLSDEVKNDPYKIAASSDPVNLSADNTNTGNNENALKLAALGTSASAIEGTGFEAYLKNIAVGLGISSAHCSNMLAGEDSLVSNLENRKEAVSGVSTDEEIIELMKYQHMYNAASRIINAIDSALDKLINETGMVGR